MKEWETRKPKPKRYDPRIKKLVKQRWAHEREMERQQKGYYDPLGPYAPNKPSDSPFKDPDLRADVDALSRMLEDVRGLVLNLDKEVKGLKKFITEIGFCPECMQKALIPEGDYLCKECRERLA